MSFCTACDLCGEKLLENEKTQSLQIHKTKLHICDFCFSLREKYMKLISEFKKEIETQSESLKKLLSLNSNQSRTLKDVCLNILDRSLDDLEEEFAKESEYIFELWEKESKEKRNKNQTDASERS